MGRMSSYPCTVPTIVPQSMVPPMCRKRHLQGAMERNISRGLTLIEVVIPILIVAITVMGLLTSFLMGRVHTAVSRHRIHAANLLRARLEELKANGYDFLNTFSPNPCVETNLVLDTGQDELLPNDDLLCTRTTVVTDNDGDAALEIAVTVTWQERVMSANRNYSESLYTIVAPTRISDR